MNVNLLHFISKLSTDSIKKQLYIRLSNIPLINKVVKFYAQKNSPVCFVSFPKCGRTWVRVMLGKLLIDRFGLEEAKILTIAGEKGLCSAYNGMVYIHDDAAHWKQPEELELHKYHYRYKKVIFLVRDPRDVIVSIYFEKSKRVKSYLSGEKLEHPSVSERIEPYLGDLSSYLNHKIGGFETILSFYNIWEANRHCPESFLLLRYEDIKLNPCKELKRITDFIGINGVSNVHIENAVRFSSFEKMRDMERQNRFNSDKLRPAHKNDPDSYKTRKGKVSGFLDYLSQNEIRLLNEKLELDLSKYYNYI